MGKKGQGAKGNKERHKYQNLTERVANNKKTINNSKYIRHVVRQRKCRPEVRETVDEVRVVDWMRRAYTVESEILVDFGRPVIAMYLNARYGSRERITRLRSNPLCTSFWDRSFWTNVL